jgi:branched-chain amino acid aminotransferase
MAKFEGVKWAPHQMRYLLTGREFDILEPDARVFAVSKSVHYGAFLCFEGIRFFSRKTSSGTLEIVFLNWDKNLERFRRGISYNLGRDQQDLVPTLDELESLIVRQYLGDPSMREFLEEMAGLEAQGYLRPFTVDEEQSMGVTFPNRPAIRAAACRYENYLGEPFSGAVIPDMVRALGINGTGCLKLGINYLMSVKAVDAAQNIDPGAASALFLDDRPEDPIEKRHITEWDSSCCLFGFRDGTIVKIPEHNLILPSVTIQGMTAILKSHDVPVVERHILYGELVEKTRSKELVVTASIGTAGVMNRCHKLTLTDRDNNIVAVHEPDTGHPLWTKLAEAKAAYLDIYKDKAPLPPGMKLCRYAL